MTAEDAVAAAEVCAAAVRLMLPMAGARSRQTAAGVAHLGAALPAELKLDLAWLIRRATRYATVPEAAAWKACERTLRG